MFELIWPWVLLALPLPLLARVLLPAAHGSGGTALRLPFFDGLAPLENLPAGMPWRLGAGLLIWLLACLAGARPVWVGEAETQPATGRDLLLAVDVSGSMATDDMDIGGRPVTRLTAVKAVVADFLQRRAGDRVGLLLFGERAYLMTPLTFDRAVVRTQLLDSQVGIAGRETAIGDAIGLAIKRLRERPQQQRVLILLTDGVNTAGELAPLKAAELAKTEGLRVYTIGVGSERGMASLFGMSFPVPGAEIDAATLERVAEMTGGRFFRARATAELAGIYAELDRLEPAAADGKPLRPQRELFMWPLMAALTLLLLGLAVRSTGGWERWA